MDSMDWHRRHAVQLVAQLPEGREDALKVLDQARHLVENFLYADEEKPEGALLCFPGGVGSNAKLVG